MLSKKLLVLIAVGVLMMHQAAAQEGALPVKVDSQVVASKPGESDYISSALEHPSFLLTARTYRSQGTYKPAETNTSLKRAEIPTDPCCTVIPDDRYAQPHMPPIRKEPDGLLNMLHYVLSDRRCIH